MAATGSPWSERPTGDCAKLAFAVLPIAKYERLLDLAEDRADAVEAGRVAARIAGKTHPLKLWRQHRAMTLAGLGDACGVTRSAVPKIENGEIRRKLATALRCEMDDLA